MRFWSMVLKCRMAFGETNEFYYEFPFFISSQPKSWRIHWFGWNFCSDFVSTTGYSNFDLSNCLQIPRKNELNEMNGGKKVWINKTNSHILSANKHQQGYAHCRAPICRRTKQWIWNLDKWIQAMMVSIVDSTGVNQLQLRLKQMHTHREKETHKNAGDLRDKHTIAFCFQQFEINETMMLYCVLHTANIACWQRIMHIKWPYSIVLLSFSLSLILVRSYLFVLSGTRFLS